MSLTIQQILADAKRLTDKLKDDDNLADKLLSQTQSVYKQVDAMKHYADDLAELNESAKQGPHGEIIVGLQQENKQLRDLQIENRELKVALQDYQNAVELIMSKYRSHTALLLESSKIDYRKLFNENQNQIIQRQIEKINEMAMVMRSEANFIEQSSLHNDGMIKKLSTENEGLRDMLAISKRYGSLNMFRQSLDKNSNEEKT